MVTSSVTSSRRTPAGSGHFTLLSGADKSRTPDKTRDGDLIAIAFRRRLCGGSNGCRFAVNAGARGTGLRGRLTAADRMNLNWLIPAKGGSIPHSHSRKVYVIGTRADLRVPMREIALSGGNPPLRLYDTSGPYTDPSADLDLKRGLAPLRLGWIIDRD